jgi:hypothetical protein
MRADSIRIEHKTNLQTLTELDRYPNPGHFAGFYPGSILAGSNRTSYKVTLQTLPELNSFPAASTDFLAGYYPGSALAESNRVNYEVTLQALPELDRYKPFVVPEQAMTSFLEPPLFRRHEQRKALRLPELNEYPQVALSAAELPALYKVEILYRRGTVRVGLDVVELPWLAGIAAAVPVTNPKRNIIMCSDDRDIIMTPRGDTDIVVSWQSREITIN